MAQRPFRVGIIPLREMEGNYNSGMSLKPRPLHYTLERDGRELQQIRYIRFRIFHYTLERDGRELQPISSLNASILHYTLERDGRELQLSVQIVEL